MKIRVSVNEKGHTSVKVDGTGAVKTNRAGKYRLNK